MKLHIELIGQVKVSLDDQPIEGFVSDKVMALLAYLCLQAEGQPRARLAGMLWGAMPEKRAYANLRMALYNLGQLLPDCLNVDRNSVALKPGLPVWLDVDEFEKALRAQVSPAGESDHSFSAETERIAALNAALNLYRGEFLQDLQLGDAYAFEEWILVQRERLRRLALQGFNLLAEILLNRQEYSRAVNILQNSLALDGWQEAAHRQLMRLYAAQGNYTEALAQYAACRRSLQEGLGVAPMPETTALYERIRAMRSKPQRHNLPARPAHGAERVTDLRQVVRALADPHQRLVSLVGPAGSGKTGLAIQAAYGQLANFIEGVFFVPLEKVVNVAELPSAILAALHYGPQPGPEEPAGQLVRYLAGREILLVLDHCEHLLAGTGLIERLLAETAELKLLVTSREPFGLPWETVLPVAPPPVAPHLVNFPETFTRFVGREDELAKILDYLRTPECRLITLKGPGGSGKTRLAIEAARWASATKTRFAGGIFFLPLADIPSEALFITGLAAALGLNLREGNAPRTQLLNYLKAKEVLLILDSYEHLAGREKIVAQILAEAPGVTLLVTSQRALNLRAEWLIPLDGLPFPDEGHDPGASENPAGLLEQYSALQLFHQMACRVRPNFTPTRSQWQDVFTICRQVDGLPLAIEIAAAWLRVYATDQIAAQTSQHFDFLVSPLRDIPARHHSLQAVFETSWQLLSAVERQVLAGLTVFRGGFTLEAARQVTDASDQDLASLADWSLVQRISPGRYMLHTLLRQFAAEKLEAITIAPLSAQTVRERHAQFFLEHFLGGYPADRAGDELRAAWEAIHREQENVRQAWEWAIVARRSDLLAAGMEALSQYYWIGGPFQEGVAAFAPAADRLQSLFEQASNPFTELARSLARLRLHEARFRLLQGQPEIALNRAEQALRLAEQSGDPPLTGRALTIIAQVEEAKGEYQAALEHCARAHQICAAADDRPGLAAVLGRTGSVHRLAGNYSQAREYYQDALELMRRSGDQIGIAQNLGDLGLVYESQSDYPQALGCFQEALDIALELGFKEAICRQRNHIGLVYWHMGDLERAFASYQQGLRIARQLGLKHAIASIAGNIGVLHRQSGDYSKALEAYREALEIFIETNEPAHQANLYGNIGNIYLLYLGEFDQALSYYQTSLKLSQQHGFKEVMGRVYGYIGLLYALQEQHGQAVGYFEQGIAWLRELNAKYYLAWQLIDLAWSLFVLQDYGRAPALVQEGIHLSSEIGRRDTLLQGRLLQACLQVVTAGAEQGRQQLAQLQQDFQGEEDQALILFELWRLDGVEEVRQKALVAFHALAQKDNLIFYRKKIEALQNK